MDPSEYYERQGLRGWARDVRWALADKTPISFSRRLQATRAGFKPESSVAFRFDKNDPRDYLPDTSWRKLSRTNCQAAQDVLSNKLLFYLTFRHELPLPTVHGFIANGQVTPLAGTKSFCSLQHVTRHLVDNGPLIVKPMAGDKGRGVHLIESRDGELLKDGKPLDEAALHEFLRGRDGALLVERVKQARFAEEIFSGSTNSLRINIFSGAGTGYQPFVAVAGHKFGRLESVPVDNTAKGGIICNIDLETGRLQQGRRLPKGAPSYLWFDTHPDTGAQLTGVEVPGFFPLLESLLDFTKRHSYLAYVGWDVVMTETGFVVLEANHHASIRIQVAKPFLTDPRIVAFLEHHDLLPAAARDTPTMPVGKRRTRRSAFG